MLHSDGATAVNSSPGDRNGMLMIAILWLATTIFIITFEEPALRSKFGDDYAAYCRNVRRWIPRLRPFDNSQPAA